VFEKAKSTHDQGQQNGDEKGVLHQAAALTERHPIGAQNQAHGDNGQGVFAPRQAAVDACERLRNRLKELEPSLELKVGQDLFPRIAITSEKKINKALEVIITPEMVEHALRMAFHMRIMVLDFYGTLAMRQYPDEVELAQKKLKELADLTQDYASIYIMLSRGCETKETMDSLKPFLKTGIEGVYFYRGR